MSAYGFLLFAGERFYPAGGAKDCHGRFKTPEQAMQAHDPQKFSHCKDQWAHVLCVRSLRVVRRFEQGEWSECDDGVPTWEPGW